MRFDVRVVLVAVWVCAAPFLVQYSRATDNDGVLDGSLKAGKVGLQTDTDTVRRENERINPNGFSVAEQKQIEESSQRFTFNAEVNKLMQIIVHSLYSNSEVFLRELISNASDALDKIRFLSLTDPKQLGEGELTQLDIRIKADPEARTITITDRGIGMTKEDLVKNLGTIAQSGTKAFLERHKEYSDSNLIGQFGVGFYSVFLVADEVVVVSKHNDDKQHIWTSSADGSFQVSEDPRGNTLGRGTQIIIQLKEDAIEFGNPETLKALVRKYSQFITFPIYVWSSHEASNEVPLSPEEIEAERAKLLEKKQREIDEASIDEEVVDLDGSASAQTATVDDSELPQTKTEKKEVWEWEVLNDVKPLWIRAKEAVTDEEYIEFFKSGLKEYSDPLHWAHFTAEGEIDFKALLYVPSTPPPNMFDSSQKREGMKLYVRRVFITDDFTTLLPKYLSFLRGVVDSDDLPLNVSREQLQAHKTLKVISKKLVRKAIAMIQEMKEKAHAKDAKPADVEKYKKFWESYGASIKLGVIEDPANRTRLSKLLQFMSSRTGELTYLEDYVTRMKKGQDAIYYLGGESEEAIAKSPLLERLQRRGFEVLYMVDPIDEYAMQNLNKFDGKFNLVNAGREGLKLPGEETTPDREKEDKDRLAPLVAFLKSKLSAHVDKVVISRRLTTSPVALVTPQYGYTANMERIIKAQALADPNSRAAMYQGMKRTLEINPRHPIINELAKRAEAAAGEEAVTDVLSEDVARLLYETAKLTSGFAVDNPADFATVANKMMARALGVQGEQVEEEDIQEAEDADPSDDKAEETEGADEDRDEL